MDLAKKVNGEYEKSPLQPIRARSDLAFSDFPPHTGHPKRRSRFDEMALFSFLPNSFLIRNYSKCQQKSGP